MIRTDAGPHGPAHILAALLRCRYNRDITILQRNFRPIFPVGSLTGAPRKPALFSVAEQQSQHERTPTQRRRTVGIRPMERPSLVTRFFLRVIAWAERLNLALSKVGNPPIYNNATFPWTGSIEKEWRAIRVELDRVLTRKEELPAFHELASDVTSISQNNNWKTFLLAGYGFRS